MSHNIPTLEIFDCEGDPNSVGSRWEKWKRAVKIYFLATNTEKPINKRAILLHTGGLALQDIYFNIPEAHVEDNSEVNICKIAICKLDEYFSPKQSYIFERHIFRLMKQELDEIFLIRLRRQISKCNFSNENENLIDQIVEKCNSTELRKKILLQGDTITIDKIILEANALETLNQQLTEFHNKPSTSVNKIDTKSRVRDKDKEMKEKGKINEDRKRKATDRQLEIGGKVYVKNFVKENKLTPEFDLTQHTVVSTSGNEVNVRNDDTGKEYKRTIVHLKKVEGQWKIINKENRPEEDTEE